MHHDLLRKGLIINIILILVGSSIPSITGDFYNSDTKVQNYFPLTGGYHEVLLEDDFDDNIKNYSKWGEYWGGGEWFEQNQRTELSLLGTSDFVQEGIMSKFIPVTITDSYSVKLSADVITDIFSTDNVGQLRCLVSNGPGVISICYDRETGYCMYQTTNVSDWIILGSHTQDTWSIHFEIYTNRYRFIMDTIDSGWIYDFSFSSTSEITMYLYTYMEDCEGCQWQAGYDNAAIQGLSGNRKPPVADFTYSPQYPTAGETVTFNASSSYDPNGYITLYEWDWDNDGMFDESSSHSQTTRIWYENGFYPVTLKVTDNESLNDTLSKTVRIGGITTLYVGGTGPNNFTKIQDALDVTIPGDTVFVYDESSPYSENLRISTSISLIGENKETTIINGSTAKNTITISADWVNVSNFTVLNDESHEYDYGIYIHSDHTHIFNNIIKNIAPNPIGKNIGIQLNGSYHNIRYNEISNQDWGLIADEDNDNGNNMVTNNIITDIDQSGIFLKGDNNVIRMNQITDAGDSIGVVDGINNIISLNTAVITDPDRISGSTGMLFGQMEQSNISYNTIDMLIAVNENPDWHSDGMHISRCTNLTAYGNSISNCYRGIWVLDSSNISTILNNISDCWYGIIHEVHDPNITFSKKGNILDQFKTHSKNLKSTPPIQTSPHRILKNNFIRVLFPARSLFVILADLRDTSVQWGENYWGRSRVFPKAIISFFKVLPKAEEWGIPMKIEFDLRPAKQPYEIPRLAI